MSFHIVLDAGSRAVRGTRLRCWSLDHRSPAPRVRRARRRRAPAVPAARPDASPGSPRPSPTRSGTASSSSRSTAASSASTCTRTASGEAWVQLGRVPGGIRWLVRILNLYAGYSAPLWAGVLLVTGVLHGSRWLPVAVLGVIGLVALVFVRNWFGLLVVLGFDVLALWVALRPSETTVLVVAAVGAFFVVDGLRSVMQVARWLLTGARVQTDFHIAAAEMRVPAGVWFVLFVLVNGLAVWLARVPLLEVWDTVVAGVRALF
ncbi:M50 family metallopeptidase [Sphingomonas sp. LR61]|uniref:M50 family metallopeptidase n=1 Tax=Sphingomonas sp. LR61 TaxID=3050234 RepID=UPI002FE1AA1F